MYEDRYIYNISPKVFALMMVVFLLTVVDFTVTRYGVTGGLIDEGNPLLASVMESPSQIPGMLAILAIGMGIKFLAHNAGEWIKWPMLLALVSRVLVLWMHWQWVRVVG